ncbi:MAG TPA: hypothetical protein VFS40_06735 [Gemmatimonadales bacterium]|nr:hypothetical protein [Gemmatimonadales bacterium]
MPHFVCVTCGTQFAESAAPPAGCPICEDERQWVRWEGQAWTTLDELRRDHANRIAPEGPGLTGIGTEPAFAIGQRALHVAAPAPVLWDCVTVLDDASVRRLQALGGVTAIAISHPHYYSACVEWSRALGGVPVYLHAADREWVMRPDDALVFWEGETQSLGEGLTLIRTGGHFAGGTVLHWAAGAGGGGALLTGDLLQVTQDRRWISVMYSYPNLIPVDADTLRRVTGAVAPYRFEQIYGAWWGRNILADAEAVVRRSAERYLRAIGGAAGGRDGG